MKYCFALLLAAAGWMPAHAAPDITWTPIHWESAHIGGRRVEKAALMVPVQLEGRSARILAQLDLGSDLSQFDAVPYEQLFGKGTAPTDRPGRLAFTGVLGGVRVQDYRGTVVPRRGHASPPGQPVLLGTLGAEFFRNRILLLDFVRQQFCILDEGAKLPASLERAAKFAPLTVRNGNLMVPLTINGKTETDFFYDTGASLFPVSTTRARWQALTGRTGTESDNEVWRVNSWGREAVMVGAPIRGDLRLDDAKLANPLVFFESSGIPNLANVNLFGNALFFDRFTVIVDIAGHRFGLIPAERK
jgi:hypothetical protein